MATPPLAPPPGKSATVVALRPTDPHAAKYRRKQKALEHPEEVAEEGDGNWIVSYADMMTLLCVFFVLMYSMANPDPKKYEEMKRETSQYFGGVYKQPYRQLLEKLQGIVKERGLEKVVAIDADESGVTATFRGTLFFDSGRTDLSPNGADVLTQLGGVIKKEAPGFKLIVEGHTDDSPISSATYPSNWELSGSRASRVIRMFESQGFDRKLLTAIGFGDTRPLVPNRDAKGVPIPQNQSQNRRVILKIMKSDAPGAGT